MIRTIMDTNVDRPAQEEYTPAQRKAVDRELAKGLLDLEQGRVHGRF